MQHSEQCVENSQITCKRRHKQWMIITAKANNNNNNIHTHIHAHAEVSVLHAVMATMMLQTINMRHYSDYYKNCFCCCCISSSNMLAKQILTSILNAFTHTYTRIYCCEQMVNINVK